MPILHVMSAEPVTITEPPGDTLPVGVKISRNVRAITASRGLGLKALASATGIPYKRLSERLNGHTKWSADDVAQVAAVLDIDPGRLFDDPIRTGSDSPEALDALLGQMDLAFDATPWRPVVVTG